MLASLKQHVLIDAISSHWIYMRSVFCVSHLSAFAFRAAVVICIIERIKYWLRSIYFNAITFIQFAAHFFAQLISVRQENKREWKKNKLRQNSYTWRGIYIVCNALLKNKTMKKNNLWINAGFYVLWVTQIIIQSTLVSLGHSFYVQIKTIADNPTGSLVPLKYFHIEVYWFCVLHTVWMAMNKFYQSIAINFKQQLNKKQFI